MFATLVKTHGSEIYKQESLAIAKMTARCALYISYCSPVWSPYTIGLINRVASVQKVFTKKLPGMRNLHCEERLLVLSLESLEVRRIKKCFKILKGMTSITCSEFFTLSGSCTRGHSLKLYCPDSRVNIRAQFFAIRVIDVWNRCLRILFNTADTVASFVRGINSLGAHLLVPD